MRYRTAGYAWRSRLLYWSWWVLVLIALLGTVWASVTHQAGGTYLLLIACGVSANSAYLSDRYILRDYPSYEERRSA